MTIKNFNSSNRRIKKLLDLQKKYSENEEKRKTLYLYFLQYKIASKISTLQKKLTYIDHITFNEYIKKIYPEIEFGD